MYFVARLMGKIVTFLSPLLRRGGGTSAPSEYMVKVYPIENDFDRFETIGPVSSRDECAAKAMEMKAAAYECQPN